MKTLAEQEAYEQYLLAPYKSPRGTIFSHRLSSIYNDTTTIKNYLKNMPHGKKLIRYECFNKTEAWLI